MARVGKIAPDEYETYRALILSGQIPQEGVPKLLEANPEFADWYRRQQGLPPKRKE